MTLGDALTAVALIVSGGALVLGIVNCRRANRLNRRDLFLRMHEALLEPSVVAGRRAPVTVAARSLRFEERKIVRLPATVSRAEEAARLLDGFDRLRGLDEEDGGEDPGIALRTLVSGSTVEFLGSHATTVERSRS